MYFNPMTALNWWLHMPALMLYVILTAIPLYVANAAAMIFGGKTPMDFGVIWKGDGLPLLGKGKTWKGSGMGILLGTFAGLLAWYLFREWTRELTPNYLEYAFLLSVGAILGDMVGSFAKRRMRMERGKPAPLLDQLDFVVGGLVLGLPFVAPELIQVLVLVLITPIVHLLANRVAFVLKLKSVPW